MAGDAPGAVALDGAAGAGPGARPRRRGQPVRAAPRGRLTAAPAFVGLGEEEVAPVRAWGGPWPEEGRWWDPRAPVGCLRVQVVCVPEPGEEADPDPAADLAPDPVASSADAAGLALLLVLRDDRWSVEGITTDRVDPVGRIQRTGATLSDPGVQSSNRTGVRRIGRRTGWAGAIRR